MADSNMTVSYGAADASTKLKKIVFTQTAVGAAGNATSKKITGTLLRVMASGGDGAWNFTINDGVANVFTITGVDTAGVSNTYPAYQVAAGGVTTDDDSNFAYGIPVVDQGLLCTIANGGTAVCVITLIYRVE